MDQISLHYVGPVLHGSSYRGRMSLFMKVRVTIDRGHGLKESFEGEVVYETTTHYCVSYKTNEKGELFAKQSLRVNCIKI